MSVRISAFVDRVVNSFPHAHFTVAVAYMGWMSAFIVILGVSEGESGIALKYSADMG
jgi:hypothetical protein